MIPAVVERCAGIDIGKAMLNVCLMCGPAADEPVVQLGKFGTFACDLERLRQWLCEHGCTHVVMESTGSYWKPVYEALERDFHVILANGEDVKARKGHKTDWLDCQNLAHLLRHGLVRPSFVPCRDIRDLRDLTRRRRHLVADASSERNRVQRVLDEANVKIGNVLTDVLGVSGQLMLEKLLEGEADVRVIADMTQRKARAKIPEIIQALEGHSMRDHHRRMIRYSLAHLAFLEQQIADMDGEILQLIEAAGFLKAFEVLISIPGVQNTAGAAILAEAGPDMLVFPTAGHLSSWIGVAPGNNISGGKSRPVRSTRGNRWLRTTLVECAWAASKAKDCQFRDLFGKYSRKGHKQALIAVAHAMAVVIYRCLSTGETYREPGPNGLTDVRRERLIRQYIRRLGRLGVQIGDAKPAPTRLNRTQTGTRVIAVKKDKTNPLPADAQPVT
jgi:transposase